MHPQRSARASNPRTRSPLLRPHLASEGFDLQVVAQRLFPLMVLNVAADGYPFRDSSGTRTSHPGCVVAAPSYPAEAPGTTQDYVFHWIRDAAVTALELAAAQPFDPDEPVTALVDYIAFSRTCFDAAAPSKGHACFTIDGQPRPWSEQDDGPALQVIALLAAYDRVDPASQATAAQLIADDVAYVLQVRGNQTTSPWEEHQGFSFFARAVQLRCLKELRDNSHGLPVPAGTDDAIAWLTDALAAHWDGSVYRTLIGGTAPGDPQQPTVPDGYDPNTDIVLAAVYGAVAVDDPRLLATAAALRATWTDAGSSAAYPVNAADLAAGVGPLIGRYPGDTYDGGGGSLGRHPWALCTAAFAQLYAELAARIEAGLAAPQDPLASAFFAQVDADPHGDPAAVVAALRAAADAMLRAVLRHSDHLALSEQFDGVTGFESSVRDLTWSYAAFLSAVRALSGAPVRA